jgi:hypothetical protein
MHRFDVNRLPLEGAGGLIDALATVPDPRHRRGVRHPVRGLLVVAVAAVLAGARGFQAIAELAAELAPDVLRRLGIPRGTPPSVKCFRLTLQRLDGDRFDRVLSAWLVQQQILTDHVVAIDGKTLRGSATATTPAQHLLSAILPDLGVVVAQQAVSAKTNEIPGAAPLLASLPLDGAVVTADALHTQTATAQSIVVDNRANYLFTVKDNQRLQRSPEITRVCSREVDHPRSTPFIWYASCSFSVERTGALARANRVPPMMAEVGVSTAPRG